MRFHNTLLIIGGLRRRMAGLTTLSYVKANVSGLDNEVMLGLFLALLLR